MSQIGNRIHDRRVQLGLSVDEVAIKLGKNRATVYRYENSDIESVPINVVYELSKILDVDPGFLAGWPQKTENEPALTERDELIDEIYLVISNLSPEKQAELLRYARYLEGAPDTP